MSQTCEHVCWTRARPQQQEFCVVESNTMFCCACSALGRLHQRWVWIWNYCLTNQWSAPCIAPPTHPYLDLLGSLQSVVMPNMYINPTPPRTLTYISEKNSWRTFHLTMAVITVLSVRWLSCCCKRNEKAQDLFILGRVLFPAERWLLIFLPGLCQKLCAKSSFRMCSCLSTSLSSRLHLCLPLWRSSDRQQSRASQLVGLKYFVPLFFLLFFIFYFQTLLITQPALSVLFCSKAVMTDGLIT